MKRVKEGEVKYGKFYTIHDLIVSDDNEYLIQYINCDTSGDYATNELMVCKDIDEVKAGVTLKLEEAAGGTEKLIDTTNSYMFIIDGEFYVCFSVYGDHDNDNFTSIQVFGACVDGKVIDDLECLEIIVNKFIKN